MSDYLLSVIVPTKNRYCYLLPLIDLFASFKEPEVELVVQDNSDDNSEILRYLTEKKIPNVKYCYCADRLSQTDNSELAVQNASGKYVSYVGDDDFFSIRLLDYVREMDKRGIESAVFSCALYSWPGTQYKAHKFPNLVIWSFRKRNEFVDIHREWNKLLSNGAAFIGKLPQVYHGVVLKQTLLEAKDKTGSFFPGASPDIANAAALAAVCKTHLYCDVPFITSGKSPKSAAGLGVAHNHVGELGKIAQLPDNVADIWHSAIPRVWTVETIYAQSVYQTMSALGLNFDEAININRMYGYFLVFHPNYYSLLRDAMKYSPKASWVKLLGYGIGAIALRARMYIRNYVLTHIGIGGERCDDLPDTCLAGKTLDERLARIDISELFDKLKS